MTYILVTPAKNEQEFLPIVAKSVKDQSLLPEMWLIVDDGSTDKTPVIIKKLSQDNPWIISIRLPPHPRDLYYHYSFVCKEGFDYIQNFCSEKEIGYQYIGLLDADTELEPEYFKKLILKFSRDPKLGIASGTIHDKINGRIVINNEGHLPRGTGRLWTRDCFKNTEGYKVEAAAHSISNVKAILRGYTINKFDDIIAIQQRSTRSAEGLWKTYLSDGALAYYLNKHPILILLNCIHHSFKPPFYLGIPYLFGYITSSIKMKLIIDDEEVKHYYWSTRLHDLFK